MPAMSNCFLYVQTFEQDQNAPSKYKHKVKAI